MARAAAFFDLDKTVIARSSMMAFAPAFRRAGLLSRSALLHGAWSQLWYQRWGAGPYRLERMQRAVLRTTAGWQQEEVTALVASLVATAIDPLLHDGAMAAIASHRAAGRAVVLVSAAPEEVVGPIGERLGVDAVIASRAVIDTAGRYSGVLDRYAYGPAKAVLIQDWAAAEGVDLAASWAYSDSATDVPMLEAVGHAVAVNPDRVLRRVASMRHWEIARWAAQPAGPAVPVPADGEGEGEAAVAVDGTVPSPGSTARRRTSVTVGAALALATATGGATAWWAWRRPGRMA